MTLIPKRSDDEGRGIRLRSKVSVHVSLLDRQRRGLF